MKQTAIVSVWLLVASPVLAQTHSGVIAGTLSDVGGRVAGATVEARNIATDALYATVSDVDGFMLSELPAGTYEVVVPRLGWRTERFVQSDVVVTSGETVRMDIELVMGNLGVIGDDDAFLAVRNRYADLEGDTPRTADGRPDLSGVWQGSLDPNQATPDLLPWAAAEMDTRNANFHRDSPAAACLPEPVPVWPTLYKFVQTPTVLVQLFEAPPGYRQVFMDGRSHPKELDPTWMGHSVGRWDGDTLVIATVGFNDRSWLWDGYPHTEQLHVVERYSRRDLAHLDVHVRMEDPGALASPWELNMVWRLAPGEELIEYICNENNLFDENVGR